MHAAGEIIYLVFFATQIKQPGDFLESDSEEDEDEDNRVQAQLAAAATVGP